MAYSALISPIRPPTELAVNGSKSYTQPRMPIGPEMSYEDEGARVEDEGETVS